MSSFEISDKISTLQINFQVRDNDNDNMIKKRHIKTKQASGKHCWKKIQVWR